MSKIKLAYVFYGCDSIYPYKLCSVVDIYTANPDWKNVIEEEYEKCSIKIKNKLIKYIGDTPTKEIIEALKTNDGVILLRPDTPKVVLQFISNIFNKILN